MAHSFILRVTLGETQKHIDKKTRFNPFNTHFPLVNKPMN